MAIAQGQKIEASDWNTYARTRSKTTIDYISSYDNVGDDSVSSSGNFWVRSSGWSWPDFYDSNIEYATAFETPSADSRVILEDDLIAETSGGYTRAYIAKKDYPAMPPSSNDDETNWSHYRFEFGAEAIAIGNEVVYGGGLFVSTTGSEDPPVAPTVTMDHNGAVVATDINYTRLHGNNTQIFYRNAGFDSSIDIFLLKVPSADEVHFLDMGSTFNDDVEHTHYMWLPPGYYRYTMELDDTGVATFKRGKLGIYAQQYDDNVKQYKTIRTFNSSIADLNNLNAGLYGEITAAKSQTDPRLTDDDIEKKGGYLNNYTGDW